MLGLGLAASRAVAAVRVDYLRDVKPILTARCYTCHGALRQKASLRLDTAAFLREGGDTGPAIVAGKSSASLLIARITGKQTPRMPPKIQGEPLNEQEISLIRAWIDAGAAAPAAEKPESDVKSHWAFRTPVRAAVPGLKHRAWIRNPIDAFLAAEHEKRGLIPQPAADKLILLRRVYLDLIGLPPSRADLAAFVADVSQEAYEKVVDKLLASKQYGERWGRHWMDVWRYSDWWGLGAEPRNSHKHIWHWRDWIVESLNRDKGYDQMLREMLAGDELYPNDLNRLRATGYLARSYFKFNRNSWLDETIEHTAKAFIGLTMNCARCHDHKYDPISQSDYYRMRAFFEPYQVRTDQLPGEVDLEKDGLPRAFDCNLDAPTYIFVRGDEKRPKKDRAMTLGVPALLSLGGLKIKQVPLPAEAHSPGLRPFVLADYLRAAEGRIAAARVTLEQARKTKAPAAVVVAEKTLAAALLEPATIRARAAADRARLRQPTAGNAKELARQAARAERQVETAQAEASLARASLELTAAPQAGKTAAQAKFTAARAALANARKAQEVPGETYTPLRGGLKTLESNIETEASRNRPFPAISTGRRSALARWMTSPKHPLTARVAVNHLWLRHFGQPLVPTVFDFGRKGSPPTHPQLLDWLAVELREHGWSMKHLHRLMVTSNAYRMSSSSAGAAATNRSADAANRCYWRMNPVRMQAEVIWDSLLSLAGELDPRLGGPPLPVTEETSRRRSIYFVHSHNDHQRFLSMFDGASVLECYRRAESIVPQQALALENSKLALSASEKIAARLSRQPGSLGAKEFVRAAFETILAGRPTAAEQAACEQALAEWMELHKKEKVIDPKGRARANLVHALLNHNDFITIR
jgi:hypothetical protein